MWILTKSGDPDFKFVADGFVPAIVKGIEELELLALFSTSHAIKEGVPVYFFNQKNFWLTTIVKSVVYEAGKDNYIFTTRNSEYKVTKETV